MKQSAVVNSIAFQSEFESDTPVPQWWRSKVSDFEAVFAGLEKGKTIELGQSPGGRPVRGAMYGHPESHLQGTANFNSAVAAGDEKHYWNRVNRQRPVLMIVAGMHGHETEGMVAAASLIRILENGVDLLDQPQPALREKLQRLNVVIIPLLNPDGRDRVPYDGLVGIPTHEMHRVGQGTKPDGTPYGWPGCKAVHPMTSENVGSLGGYFDDAGVNHAHADFFCHTSPISTALMRLVTDQAPDVLLNLHSHECDAAVLPVHSVPPKTSRILRKFAERLYQRFNANEIPHQSIWDDRADAGGIGQFNVNSAFYHTGAHLPMTFESPHSTIDAYWKCLPGGYEQILRLHHVLFESAADDLLAGLLHRD